MDSWWEILSVFLLSTVKFVFGGVPLALTYSFPFFESVTVTSLGGFTGSISFIYLSDKIIAYYHKLHQQKLLANPNHKRKNPFTKKVRFIVGVKKKFGLTGIALLTPLILSIPVGCFIAVRYYKNKQKILIYMFSSVLIWSAASYYLYKPLIYAIRTYLF